MIEAMNDNQTNILDFPIQITDASSDDISVDELFCRTRMKLVIKLNLHYHGKYQITEEDKQGILIVNDVFRRNGYQTIDVDFSRL